MANGLKATLIDPKRKVLAFYIKRTGLLKRTPSISDNIADLKGKVDQCIKDFIVVHDEDEILVIVDMNDKRKDQAAFTVLTQEIEKLISKNGDTYRTVDYPNEPLYDPRRIYSDKDYGGFKVAKKRTMGLFR